MSMEHSISEEEIAKISSTYESKSTSDARTEIGPLTDQVAYRQKRLVLTKQAKPVAALVPMSDLARLHQLDREKYLLMRRAADHAGADTQETLSLNEVRVTGSRPAAQGPTFQSLLAEAMATTLVQNLEQRIVDHIVLSFEKNDITVQSGPIIRDLVREGVQESFETVAVPEPALTVTR